MNSSVKQAQKDGATVGDISAGLAYAVVRNALYKVIKLRDADQLGERVVVQGGTFLNDAVLRAFELLTGREVVRPDVAGLMGAYGAALIAHARFVPGSPGRLRSVAELGALTVATETEVCTLCQNHCQCTISTFSDGSRYVSGNRCERGADRSTPKSDLPNLFDWTYKRLFSYRRLTAAAAVRGDIGVPRALNMYESYPFWFTVLSRLGFRVIVSGRSSHDLFTSGMDSIASENVCYPAKLAHGHVVNLVERGVRTIWYPSIAYEQDLVAGADNHYSCPVVASYPQVIAHNVEQLRAAGVRYLNPFLNLADRPTLARRLVEVFADWDVTAEEAAAALEAGYAEDARFRADVRAAGAAAVPPGPGGAPRAARADHRSGHGGAHRGRGARARRRARRRAAAARAGPVGVPLAAVRGGSRGERPGRPGARAAELLRLRAGRDHLRAGRGDPGGPAGGLHLAEDRRGVQPGRRADPAALAAGRRGRARRSPPREHLRRRRGARSPRGCAPSTRSWRRRCPRCTSACWRRRSAGPATGSRCWSRCPGTIWRPACGT
jgi:hypothetical protein